MLHRGDIIVGKCYVDNERKIARLVLGVDRKTVKFNTYHMDTGNSCGSPSEWSGQEFNHWADHEATPAEIAKLGSHEREALFRAPQSSNQAELKHGKVIDPPAVTSRAA